MEHKELVIMSLYISSHPNSDMCMQLFPEKEKHVFPKMLEIVNSRMIHYKLLYP